MSPEKRERLPVSVSSAIFIEDEQGRLLLLQQAAERKGHRWGPPAGGMEAHENPIMGALREAREEIGVEIELIDLIGIYTVDRGDTSSSMGFVFRGKISQGKPPVLRGREQRNQRRYGFDRRNRPQSGHADSHNRGDRYRQGTDCQRHPLPQPEF